MQSSKQHADNKSISLSKNSKLFPKFTKFLPETPYTLKVQTRQVSEKIVEYMILNELNTKVVHQKFLKTHIFTRISKRGIELHATT